MLCPPWLLLLLLPPLLSQLRPMLLPLSVSGEPLLLLLLLHPPAIGAPSVSASSFVAGGAGRRSGQLPCRHRKALFVAGKPFVCLPLDFRTYAGRLALRWAISCRENPRTVSVARSRLGACLGIWFKCAFACLRALGPVPRAESEWEVLSLSFPSPFVN